MKRKSEIFQKDQMSIELHNAAFITNIELPSDNKPYDELINKSMLIELFVTVENKMLFLEKIFSLN